MKIKYDAKLRKNKLTGHGGFAYCLSYNGAKKIIIFNSNNV